MVVNKKIKINNRKNTKNKNNYKNKNKTHKDLFKVYVNSNKIFYEDFLTNSYNENYKLVLTLIKGKLWNIVRKKLDSEENYKNKRLNRNLFKFKINFNREEYLENKNKKNDN